MDDLNHISEDLHLSSALRSPFATRGGRSEGDFAVPPPQRRDDEKTEKNCVKIMQNGSKISQNGPKNDLKRFENDSKRAEQRLFYFWGVAQSP